MSFLRRNQSPAPYMSRKTEFRVYAVFADDIEPSFERKHWHRTPGSHIGVAYRLLYVLSLLLLKGIKARATTDIDTKIWN